MKGNLHNYQIILVVGPKVEDKDREKIFTKTEQWLETNGASVAKKDHMGPKDLVYEIAGVRKGDFWILEVEAAAPLKLKELNLFFNREVNVIRYLILKSPPTLKLRKGE